MKQAETAEEKLKRMTQTPVRRLVCTLAVPTIISMMVTSIYNMADTFFVGRLGTSATGAVGIAFSLMAVIQAIGFTLGMGSGNFISRLLGQRKRKLAERVAATAFFTALGLGVILAAVGLLFLDPLVRMLGATETIAPHARNYVRYILIGMPFMTSVYVLNNLLRFQGSAMYAMLGIASGGILNIALDPLFIFVFDMGTGGAALATIISQFISFLILLFQSTRGGNIRIRLRNFMPKAAIYKTILAGGLPSFYRQGLASVAMICMNLAAGGYGDAVIAAMSIVNRIMQFALFGLLGFGQGFQPVCGFNYGAGRYDRVLEAFWFCMKTAVVLLLSLGTIGFIFAPQLVAIFRADDMAVIQIGTLALRLQCATFALSSWVVMQNMLMQTIGKSTKASILALARQGLFFLPAIWILPLFWGVLGVQMSQPAADICTFILAVPLGISVLRELNQKKLQQSAKQLDYRQSSGLEA